MTGLVVDADVVAACILGEAVRGEEGQAVLQAAEVLWAPDYLRIEVANVLWKAALQGRLAEDAVPQALAAVAGLGIDWSPAGELLAAATERALRVRHPVYDMLYVELAEQKDVFVVSFDTRLQRACPDRVLSPVDWLAQVRASVEVAGLVGADRAEHLDGGKSTP